MARPPEYCPAQNEFFHRFPSQSCVCQVGYCGPFYSYQQPQELRDSSHEFRTIGITYFKFNNKLCEFTQVPK